jgi:hypothetical protein
VKPRSLSSDSNSASSVPTKVRQTQIGHDRVEAPVREGQRLGVALSELGPRDPSPREPDHGLGDINPDGHRATLGCAPRQTVRAAGDVDDARAGPVVLIHWGVSARWAEPLIAQPLRRREKVRQIDVENIVTAPSQG